VIKLLYITSTIRCSGPTNQLYYLVQYLDRKKFEPYLVTLSPEPADSRWEDYGIIGVKLDSLGLSRIKGVFSGRCELKGKIAQIGPDIIHTQGIRADSLLSSIKPDCPWLMTVHNYPRHDYPMKFGRMQGHLMARKHLSVMCKCKHVVACSKTIACLLADNGVRAVPIQNGVALHSSLSTDAKKVIDLSKPIFVSVGSLIARKNMHFVVEAFYQYANTGNGSLVILGDGPLMDVLSVLTSHRVRLLGNVSNVADYLSACDYFVSASLSEGLPVAVLEALASGLPVLLSDIPSHFEIHEECKKGGSEIFVLGDGPSALSEKMSRVDSLFPVGSRENARWTAENCFSAQAMSQKYQMKYYELL